MSSYVVLFLMKRRLPCSSRTCPLSSMVTFSSGSAASYFFGFSSGFCKSSLDILPWASSAFIFFSSSSLRLYISLSLSISGRSASLIDDLCYGWNDFCILIVEWVLFLLLRSVLVSGRSILVRLLKLVAMKSTDRLIASYNL